jgi:hypothetical protein
MKLRTALAAGWTLAVLFICWLPREQVPQTDRILPGIPHLDKLIHGTMFLGMGALWSLAFPGRPGRVALLGAGLAAVTELGQAVPGVGRTPDLDDGLMDLAGLALGMGLAKGIGGLLGRSRAEPGPSFENG